MTLLPEGGAALPVSVTTTRKVQGGSAIPVYGYMTAAGYGVVKDLVQPVIAAL